MKSFPSLALLVFILSYTNTFAQDNAYIQYVDSIEQNFTRKDYALRRMRKGNFSFSYQFNKTTRKVKSIVSHNIIAKRMVLFIYANDTLVLISPLGQQPYYIKKDTLYYTQHVPYTTAEIAKLAKDGYNYLTLVYTRIKRKNKSPL